MSRIVERFRSVQDNEYKNISKNYVLLVLTVIIALAMIVAIAGYVLSGGILSNVHNGMILITYPTEKPLSSQASESRSISMVELPSFDFGTFEGKVLEAT
jgi:hypothetical protein